MKRTLHILLLTVNALLALGLLLSYLSVYISPAHIPFLAFFGLAFYFLLAVNLLFVLFWLSRLRWELFLSLVVIALGFNHFQDVFSLRIGGKEIPGPGEEHFRILSYNVRLFNAYGESEEDNAGSKMIRLLTKNRADIICVQEFYEGSHSGRNKKKILETLGESYQCHSKFIPLSSSSSYGIATFTRFPVAGRGDIYHSRSASLTIYTDVILDGDTVRIYNNHLQSIRLGKPERRLFKNIRLSEDDPSVQEIRRISSSLRQAFIWRADQADELSEHLSECPYPVIVCGDFNDTPVSYAYRKIRGRLNDAFVSCGTGAGFTYKGGYPANRIDFLLYSDPFIAYDFEILKSHLSDHYPLTANFSIKGPVD